MAVLFVTHQITVDVQTHPARRDERGMPVVDEVAQVLGPFPASCREQGDATWNLRIDPGAWPLRADDVVRDTASSLVWVLTGVPRYARIPGAPATVDHIIATAVLQTPTVP